MAEAGQKPVAIRVARPYATEEAFLEHELDTLTRTSVVLVGAHSRPHGVILRFEITLASGAPLLRGEGRVVGYKANVIGDEPGLTLRFTRLDPRSKALVDRAAALRDARAGKSPASIPPLPPAFTPAETRAVESAPIPTSDPALAPIPASDPALAPIPTSDPAVVATTALLESTSVGRPAGVVPTPPPEAPPPAPTVDTLETRAYGEPVSMPREDLALTEERPSATLVAHPVSPSPPSSQPRSEPAPISRPADRNALLERLRERARSLPAARVAAILETDRT